MKNVATLCILGSLSLAACGSFSPDVDEATVSDGRAMAHFSNNVLLTNILRARDYLPVNYSDLSSLSQTSSLQTSLGLSIPFGPLLGSTSRNTATPSVQSTTSPTASIASLNNTGFVVAMMTPVNPEYLVVKWNNESDIVSRKLLLYMLIKSIEIPKPDGSANYKNIVNDPSDHRDFDNLMSDLMQSNADIEPKSFTVMEAVGPNFPLIVTTAISNAPDPHHLTYTMSTNNADLSGLTLATGLSDGQFHVGNDVKGSGQLYHVYPTQVALCTSAENLAQASNDTYHDARSASYAHLSEILPTLGGINAFVGAGGHSGGGAGGSTGGSTSGTQSPSGSPGASSPGAPSASAQISQALTMNRISALVDKGDCAKDEIVVPFKAETDFADRTANFVHIEWRSPADIIEYLGALLRHEGTIGIEVTKQGVPDAMFGVSDQQPTDGKPYLEVSYDGQPRYFNGDSLRVLRIVNELVNSSKLSSGTTITQPVLFIP